MRILIFNNLYFPYQMGGAEKSVQILAEELAKYHEVFVCCYGETDKQKVINGVSVRYLAGLNLYWPFSEKRKKIGVLQKLLWHTLDSLGVVQRPKLENEIKKICPDVIHTNNLLGMSTLVWKIAKELKIPTVHTTRDYYLACPKGTMYQRKGNCIKQCIRCKILSSPKLSASQNVDSVIGISAHILQTHLSKKYFKNARIKEVIPNSVNNLSVNNVSKRFDPNKIEIGYIGRLSREKGIETILEVFAKENLSNFKLHLFGKTIDKFYERYLRKKFIKNNIVFHGYKPANEIYNTIDFVINPSLWNEPFGRTIIEGFSYSKPAIVADVGGLGELVTDNVTGFVLHKNKSLEDIFIKISSLTEEEYANLSQNAQQNSYQFQIDNQRNNYENIYHSLLRIK